MPIRVDNDVKFARINATAAGDNLVVAGTAGTRLRVVSYGFGVSAAGTVSFQDTVATPGIMAQYPLAANGGAAFAGSAEAPAFQTPVGEGIEINNPTGVTTLGHIAYLEIR